LQELVERFNTRSQAKFYIEHAGGDFTDYEREDDAYRSSLEVLRRSLDFEMPQQLVDRSLIPTFQFQKEDVVRHPLVGAIVHAYESHEAKQNPPA